MIRGKRFKELEKEVQNSADAFKAFSAAQKGSTEIGRRKEIDKITKYLQENTRLSEEAKEKNRQAHLGLHPSDITRKRMSDTMKRQLKCISLSYHKYRENGGQLKWSAYRSALSNGTIQLEGITNDYTNNT